LLDEILLNLLKQFQNTVIENAVEDLVALVTAFPLDASSDGVSEDEV
jgi:hypothetical protein